MSQTIVPGFVITQKRIGITTKGRYDEAPANSSSQPKPGMLMALQTDGSVAPHAVPGGDSERLFAIEDSLQGKTITDGYASGDPVRYLICEPGDVIYGLLPANAAKVFTGNPLMSNGDGTLVLATTNPTIPIYDSAQASTVVTNTTTPTTFDQNYTIPANTLKVGDVIHVHGEVSVPNQNSTDTLQLNLLIGATVIAATVALDVATNDIGFFDAEIVIRTIGASGTFVATGTQGIGTPGTVTAKPFVKQSTTIDTTAAQEIGIQATWSVASASDQARQDVLTIEMGRTGKGAIRAYAIDTVDNSANAAVVFCTVRVA